MTKTDIADAPSAEALETARRHFDKYLRSKDLKLTSQRHEILERAAEIRSHFSAEELVDAFRRRKNRPGKATIYRTLSLLTECGILDSHDVHASSSTIYEFAWGRPHHDHMICLSCGAMIEFVSQEIEDLQDRVAEAHGFEPKFHSQKIYGTCKDCRAAGVRR